MKFWLNGIAFGLLFSACAARAAGGLSVPCLSSDGKVVGASTATCAAILPQCSTLRKNLESSLKSQLSLKIWGYYNGKDIDLDKSTLDQLNGVSLPSPICSVVGHQLKYKGSLSDFEIANQTLGGKLSCGLRPHAEGDQGAGILGLGHGDDKMHLSFRGAEGGLWQSYLMGAYPWLIRKNASDVLSELKPDLSNLGEVMKGNAAAKADLVTLGAKMDAFYTSLSAETKSVCSSGKKDIVNACKSGTLTLTDPANRLCTLVKAQSTVDSGAVPNVILQEIMTRVQTQYDFYFGRMFALGDSDFKNFFTACSELKNGNGILGLTPRKKYSCVASCLFDGQDFYTGGDFTTEESKGSGRSSRRCEMPYHVSLSDGSIQTKAAGASLNLGFAGFMEYMIRVKICGQKNPTDDSVCDSVGILDKPENAK